MLSSKFLFVMLDVILGLPLEVTPDMGFYLIGNEISLFFGVFPLGRTVAE